MPSFKADVYGDLCGQYFSDNVCTSDSHSLHFRLHDIAGDSFSTLVEQVQDDIQKQPESSRSDVDLAYMQLVDDQLHQVKGKSVSDIAQGHVSFVQRLVSSYPDHTLFVVSSPQVFLDYNISEYNQQMSSLCSAMGPRVIVMEGVEVIPSVPLFLLDLLTGASQQRQVAARERQFLVFCRER